MMGWEGDLPFRRGGMREGGVGQGRGDACIDVITRLRVGAGVKVRC